MITRNTAEFSSTS